MSETDFRVKELKRKAVHHCEAATISINNSEIIHAIESLKEAIKNLEKIKKYQEVQG